MFYVTISDGELTAKSEIFVNVINSTNTFPGPPRNGPPFLPQPVFDNRPHPLIPGFDIFHRPTENSVDKKKIVQTNTYIPNDTNSSNVDRQNSKTTVLLPKNPEVPQFNHPLTNSPDPKTNRIDGALQSNNEDTKRRANSTENVSRPVSDLAATIIPVTSIFAIFIIVGIMAVIFRKKICPSRSNSKKANMVSVYKVNLMLLVENTNKHNDPLMAVWYL